MTRSIGRQQRAAARAKAKAEGRFGVIEGGKSLPKPPRLTLLQILVPEDVATAVDGLHEFVKRQYESRNDFLEDLLREGLRSAIVAQREAIGALKAKQIEAEAEKDQAQQQQSLVQLVPSMPRELGDYVGTRTPERS